MIPRGKTSTMSNPSTWFNVRRRHKVSGEKIDSAAARRLGVFIILVTCIASSLAPIVHADDYSRELKHLEEQSVIVVGRDTLLNAYIELLNNHPQHPDRAVTMFRIAGLWQIHAPEKNIARNPQEELKWLHRARNELQSGEELWFEIGFRIHSRKEKRGQDSLLSTEQHRTSPPQQRPFMSRLSATPTQRGISLGHPLGRLAGGQSVADVLRRLP